MKPHKKARSLTAAIIIYGSLVGGANAAVMLSIDTLTTSTFTFTLSGTIDSATAAPLDPGAFILTPYSPDLGINGWITNATSTSSTISIGGISATTVNWASDGVATGYSLYFYDDASTRPTAGTIVSGSATFTGLFDLTGISASDFKLYLGLQSNQTVGPSELIATAIPEPSSALLFGVGALGLVTFRRRNK